MQDLERRQEQQKKIQAEIKRINDENQRYKEEQLRQERLADEKILEYQKQKMVVGHGTGRGSVGAPQELPRGCVPSRSGRPNLKLSRRGSVRRRRRRRRA